MAFTIAVLSGILLVVIATIVSMPIAYLSLVPTLPHECAKWNDGHVMELTLFVSGVLMYYVMYALDIYRHA